MIFFIGLGIMVIGAGIIILTLLKFWLKFTFKQWKGLADSCGRLVLTIYDHFFVEKKGKSVPYKSDWEKKREAQQCYVADKHNREQAKEYLGAVNFVETLKLKYPNADQSMFNNMVEMLLQSKNPKDFKRIEDNVRVSHLEHTIN